MSDPQVSGDTLVAVAAELGRLGRRLDDLGGELLALRGPEAAGDMGAQVDAAAAQAGSVRTDAVADGAALRGPAAPDAEPGGSVPGHAAPSGATPAVPHAGASGVASAGRPGAIPVGAIPVGAIPVGAAHPGAGHPGAAPGGLPPGAMRPATRPPGRPGQPAPPWPGPARGPMPPPPTVRPPAPAPQPGRPSLSGAKVLAWTGGAVTLLGVVMLLVLAASRGWFSPSARLVAGGVLGIALIGLALRLHRNENSRTGAVALAGTGVAALYVVVASATAQYGFLPAPAGLGLGLLVAAGGLGLADRWRSEPLGIGAVVGAAVLAPVVTQGFVPELVALVVVLEAAAAVVAVVRGYSWLLVVAAGFATAAGVLTALLAPRADLWFTGAAAAGVFVVSVVAGILAATRGSRPALAVAAIAALPLLFVAGHAGGAAGAAVAGGVAVATLGPALLRTLGRPVRIVLLVAGALALYQATVQLLDGGGLVLAVVGEAVVLLVAAAVLRSRPALVTGVAFGALGFVGLLSVSVPPGALSRFPAASFLDGTPALLTALGASLLVVALAVTLLVALSRNDLLGSADGRVLLWIGAGLVGLYGAAGAVVSAALLVSPDRAGFVAGHAVVTVSWTVLALVLLARGIRSTPLRVAGLVLVGAAVAKLVLFDLISLDGLARVGAFLGAGLVLLAAGVRYARLVADAEPADGD